jgi:uncharacterized protein YkwD
MFTCSFLGCFSRSPNVERIIPPDREQDLLSSLQSLGERSQEVEELVFQFVNKVREENGVPTLIYDAQVATVARKHSEEMALSGGLSHLSKDGKSPAERLKELGFFWSSGEDVLVLCGENVGKVYAVDTLLENRVTRRLYDFTLKEVEEVAMEVVKGWMASEEHRGVMLDSAFRRTGVGVWFSLSERAFYITQDFL